MLIGPSDMYGDMALEDVDEFEGLQPEEERPRAVDPEGRFERDEFRNFDRDFEDEMDSDDWDDEYDDEWDGDEDAEDRWDAEYSDPLYDPEEEL